MLEGYEALSGVVLLHESLAHSCQPKSAAQSRVQLKARLSKVHSGNGSSSLVQE